MVIDHNEEASGSGGFARLATNAVAPSPTGIVFSYSSWARDLSNLAPLAWNPDLGTWEFVNNDVSVSTANRTITVESPTLGLKYAVVDLNEWRGNANQCTAAAGGHPALDVEIDLDQTWSVDSADPTGERFNAVQSVLSTLRPGDRVSVRDFGFLGVISSRAGGRGQSRSVPTAAAWGDGNYYQSIWSGADFAPTLGTVDEARAHVSEIASDPNQVFEDESNVAWQNNYSSMAEGLLGNSGDNVYGDSAQAGPHCRLHTIVLVTDGGLEPPATVNQEGYVAFRDRDVPVHVLDVGLSSEQSEWLLELAWHSGGTYSYVPTATDLTSWIDDVTPFGWTPPVADTVDSDSDGLPDNVETAGIVPTMSKPAPGQPTRFYSNPHDADTDGDGLKDGWEMGTPATLAQLGIANIPRNTSYFAVSNPKLDDSDSDGAPDLDEFELGMNALNNDPDFDDVWDGEELLWGTSPSYRDSDWDGFADRFEIDSSYQGFDPIQFTNPVSPTKWLEDVAQGYLCGEFCFNDSIGWLIGDIISGFLVFGDVRDIIAYGQHGDAVSAGWTAVGLIPALGDTASAAVLISKFLKRSTNPDAIRGAVGLADEVLEDADSAATRSLLNDMDAHIVADLEGVGVVSPKTMLHLVDANGLDHLRTLIASAKPTEVVVANIPYPNLAIGGIKAIGNAGETFVRQVLGLSTNLGKTEQVINGTKRFYDIERTVGGQVRYYEVKVGAVSGFKQLDLDTAFRTSGNDVRWVFLRSGITGRIGPAPNILSAMNSRGIPFEIHWPE
jgi:hypothetical protein